MVFKKRKNALFQIATELYNSAVLQNRVLESDEIETAFKDAPYEPVDIDVFVKDFMEDKYGQIGFGMFTKTGNGYRPVNKAPVPVVFSHDEAEWLKTMLNDNKINLFLDEETRQKLNKALAGYTPLYGEKDFYIEKNITQQDFADEKLQHVFLTALHGITERKLIRFEYQGRRNHAKTSTLTALPLKIHYHGVNDTFQCIVFDVERKLKSTLNMERIMSVMDIDGIVPNYTELPEDIVETAEIELRNETNAAVRCFMLLSDYQKIVVFDDECNTYKISILYYDFERQDLLKNLLSLGAYCTILSPRILVEQIKQRLEKLDRLMGHTFSK